MKSFLYCLVSLSFLLGVSIIGPVPLAQKPVVPTTVTSASPPSLSALPPQFEENRGQAPAAVRFLLRNATGTIGLTATALLWQPRGRSGFSAASQMRWVNGNPQAVAVGEQPLPGKVNYLLGAQPQHWRTNIPTFAQVRYQSLYAGIDLLFYCKQQTLEYDFIVAPGADVAQIKLAFTGSRRLWIEANGELVLRTSNGELRQHPPFAYQTINGEQKPVSAQFVQLSKNEIGFRLGQYNPQHTLVIDPSFSFATYLGGSDSDTGASIALDAMGNIFLAGTVNSSDFPLSATAFQSTRKGSDMFVTKLNPAGNTILYSTYLGGLQTETASSLALDTNGNAIVTGVTASADFPTTAGAYQTTLRSADAFVTKLNAMGSGLTFSTLLGGSGNEVSSAIAVDTINNIYVTGSTTSTNFPTTAGVFQEMPRGGSLDAFVTKLNATGTQLVYSSYLGGSSLEAGAAIAVDSTNQVYVTGYTLSSNFPTTAGVFQSTYKGGTNLADAFVLKVNPAGSSLVYSTYLGGAADDVANALALDAGGNVYIAGATTASGATNDFPTTANAFQKTFVGSTQRGPRSDGFVTKLNPTGTSLVYSTYLGGDGADTIAGIALNGQGAAFLTGSTGSTNFPTVGDAFKIYAGLVDAFVTQLDANGAALPYSSYLGGASTDAGVRLALDSAGNPLVVGTTQSPNFPVLPSALQPLNKGGQEVFLAAIRNSTSIVAASVTAASYRHISMGRDSIVSVFGARLATRTESGVDTDPNQGGVQLPTTLAGSTVKIKDSNGTERFAPMFFAAPTQINYQIPPGTSVGGALVTITADDGTISLGTIQVADVAPDMFSADSTGTGPVAGNAVRVKPNNVQIEEAIVRFAAGKWEFIPIDLGPDTEQVVLVLFGTGIRFRRDPPQVSATIGGVTARVDYAKEQCCFVGVDQVNLLIPRTLIGRGEVDVVLTVDGKPTLPLKIAIR